MHSGEVSTEIRTGANIADTPDEAQLNEDPQVVSGEVDNCEDTNNSGRPQRVKQAPKRLTYDSPGTPTYVRPINVNPSGGIQQRGMQTSPEPQRTSTVRCHQSWAIFLHRYHLWCAGTRTWCCHIWCPIQQDRSCHNGKRLISCFSTDKKWLVFFFVHYLVKKREIFLVYLNIRCVDAVKAILR